jgi:hypothetical protein
MAYTRGTNTNIIVGAAALFVNNFGQAITSSTIPAAVSGESYKESLSLRYGSTVRNLGYTSNGLDLTFNPTFGDVNVDQLLDVAKLYKSGMTVTLKTSLSEATLENLLLAIAQKNGSSAGATGTVAWTETVSLTGAATATTAATTNAGAYIDILSGDLGDYPVERSLIAVGPGPQSKIGSTTADDQVERVYVAYRAVSITSVTVSSKRDAATAFDVEFRLLPDDNGSYGKIVDRTY